MTTILGIDAAWTAGEPTTLVTVDMPVSTSPILGRRATDRAVSRAFGAQWCSAHSP
jgi:predicted RNase H-like nuclease